MSGNIEEFRKRIKKYEKLSILISDHAGQRIIEREIDANLVVKTIRLGENLIKVERQTKNKYKIYSSVNDLTYCIILEFLVNRIDIITGWEINKIGL